MPARVSYSIAIRLLDVARKLGVPTRLECSLVGYSDSRYLILNPKTPLQRTVRISSHPPYEPRYALCLDTHDADCSVKLGTDWLEKFYADPTTPPPARAGFGKDGPGRAADANVVGGLQAVPGGNKAFRHRRRGGGASRGRLDGSKPSRSRDKGWYLRNDWSDVD
jgi:hypothetical protein